MKNITIASSFIFMLTTLPAAMAATPAAPPGATARSTPILTVETESGTVGDALQGAEQFLANTELRRGGAPWGRPRSSLAPAQFDRASKAAQQFAAHALPSKTKYSTVPEPKVYSMLLLGAVLLVISAQKEQDEKFTA
ncbi:hypothetical protein SAMN02982985_01594 [Rugamonas rubra]|uniref:PEP-CTERM protein-sorting domain-containing protein n=2 Tax=Telluria group TaxID=2895353 RepID=A0A1I4KSD3_9BURK|nr:hypothetical protein SAMN02982985_01594 [Rugamonas rubra]